VITYTASDIAGLDPSPQDLCDLDDVLAEVEAEESAGMFGDGEVDDLWDDTAQLANGYGDYADIELAGDFGELGAIHDLAAGHQQQVIAEDIEDQLARRPTTEARIARAVNRLSRGTYMPAGMYASRDPDGQFAGRSCDGSVADAYGNCGARFHQSSCIHTVRQAAATGSHDAALAWNRTLNRGVSSLEVAALANELDDELAEAASEPADQQTYWAMRSALGLPGW
jgi:hypothetical protein